MPTRRNEDSRSESQWMALGNGLDFPKGCFGAVISVGAITQGHAPPSGFADLVEVTRPGGRIVFTLRDDAGIDPGHGRARVDLQTSGK